jgi:hypothetical protein
VTGVLEELAGSGSALTVWPKSGPPTPLDQ